MGEDPMVGVVGFYKLFDNLIRSLHDKGISCLARISILEDVDNFRQGWKSTSNLDIQGN
jgi:hypothetical protein